MSKASKYSLIIITGALVPVFFLCILVILFIIFSIYQNGIFPFGSTGYHNERWESPKGDMIIYIEPGAYSDIDVVIQDKVTTKHVSYQPIYGTLSSDEGIINFKLLKQEPRILVAPFIAARNFENLSEEEMIQEFADEYFCDDSNVTDIWEPVFWTKKTIIFKIIRSEFLDYEEGEYIKLKLVFKQYSDNRLPGCASTNAIEPEIGELPFKIE